MRVMAASGASLRNGAKTSEPDSNFVQHGFGHVFFAAWKEMIEAALS
jgi:hypothetical protein